MVEAVGSPQYSWGFGGYCSTLIHPADWHFQSWSKNILDSFFQWNPYLSHFQIPHRHLLLFIPAPLSLSNHFESLPEPASCDAPLLKILWPCFWADFESSALFRPFRFCNMFGLCHRADWWVRGIVRARRRNFDSLVLGNLKRINSLRVLGCSGFSVLRSDSLDPWTSVWCL